MCSRGGRRGQGSSPHQKKLKQSLLCKFRPNFLPNKKKTPIFLFFFILAKKLALSSLAKLFSYSFLLFLGEAAATPPRGWSRGDRGPPGVGSPPKYILVKFLPDPASALIFPALPAKYGWAPGSKESQFLCISPLDNGSQSPSGGAPGGRPECLKTGREAPHNYINALKMIANGTWI